MTRERHRTREDDPKEEAPPFGLTWSALYAAVLVYLALLVAVFYAFTKAFA